MENANDKFSVKNIIFSKALPNYAIPAPVNGHKVYTCTDCGDKFVFESSFKDHISRKSMKISYMCRYCNQFRIFFNRCNLLFHIRSHVFKTVTINVTDLKIEPLPLSLFKKQLPNPLSLLKSPPASVPALTGNAVTATAVTGNAVTENAVTGTAATGTAVTRNEVTVTAVIGSTVTRAAATEPAATRTTVTGSAVTRTAATGSAVTRTTATESAVTGTTSSSNKELVIKTTPSPSKPFCFECKSNLTKTGIGYKDRATHFMPYSNEVFSCPVCLFALPSICALKTHLRLHLQCPPFYCPECGIEMNAKNIHYPYHHDCEGFKMMRATARITCAAAKCGPFHPNDLKKHMFEFHMNMKKVYKCPWCVVACFNDKTMQKHLRMHKAGAKAHIFYQCELCPGKFVLPNHADVLLKNHVTNPQFPCWPCGNNFRDVAGLLYHFKRKHNKSDVIRIALTNILSEYEMFSSKPKKVYRVVKRCDQCERDFTYKCKYEGIHNLPNECPFECSSNMELHVRPDKGNNSSTITCFLCKMLISRDWTEIKKHYAVLHKEHKCLDAEIVLPKVNLTKYISSHKIVSKPNMKIIDKTISKRSKKVQKLKPKGSPAKVVDGPCASNTQVQNMEFICSMCGDTYENKLTLEKHMISHKDPCMAYQCMECGQSFVVKPSFSKHLLLEHGIKDTENYIASKQCYNENALMKCQKYIVSSLGPLRENQCNICREQFENPEDLEKHFRVHGMAFLLKNTSNKIQTIS